MNIKYINTEKLTELLIGINDELYDRGEYPFRLLSAHVKATRQRSKNEPETGSKDVTEDTE